MVSNPIRIVKYVFIISRPRPINTAFYIFHPVSQNVIYLCMVYICYGTSIISITLYIIKEKIYFWTIFGQLLRSLIYQNYIGAFNGSQMSVIYTLATTIGFILTIWYLAILGSIITTNLYNPQIKTLDDMRKTNMKYNSDQNFSALDSKNEITDLNSSELYFFDTALLIHDSYTDFPNTQYYFYISDIISRYSLLRIEWFNSGSVIYRERFNFYINIAQDSGLYNYWKRSYDMIHSNIAIPGMKLRQIYYKNLRILDLNYFKYAFSSLILALVIYICIHL